MSEIKKNIESVFDFFENTLPERTGEKPRLTQVQMAVDVLGFLNSKDKSFIAHAPVGVGKSYAVLVPSIFHMKKKKGRVIYATQSLNLQAQLKHNELQELKSLGLLDDYVIAKGVTNYICQKKTKRIDHPIRENLLEAVKSSSEGDRAEIESKLEDPISDDIWDEVCLKVSNKCDCCSYFAQCPTGKHRGKFNSFKYKTVVTNHNQLIQSVINKIKSEEPIIDYSSRTNTIIIDEAHYLEGAIISQLSESITLEDLKHCSRKVKDREKFEEAIKTLEKEIYKIKSQDKSELSKKMLPAVEEINKQLHHRMVSDMSRRRASGGLVETAKIVMSKIISKNYHGWVDLESDSFVVIEKNYRQSLGKIIEELSRNNKLIFTSGTLAVNNSFEHLYFAWGGRPEKSRTKIYNTIFNLEKQAMVYIPKQDVVPIPPKNVFDDKFKDYCEAQYKEIKRLVEITGGRTLVLCTSHEQVNYIYEFLKNDLEVKLLKQGHKSTELLTREFKEDEKSVLIGTGAFLSGISVNNKSLISVILCRLPFPVPDDPYFKMVSNGLNSQEAFKSIQFPYMMTKLHQAFGRLIRTRDDFGSFTILDPRAYDRAYSEKIIEGLGSQGLAITRDIEDVEEFISDKLRSFSIEYPEYNRKDITIPQMQVEKKVIRMPGKANSYKAPSYEIGCLTKEQIDYYMFLRDKVKLSGKATGKMKRLSKDPYLFFKECIKVAESAGVEDVEYNFPYTNEVQKNNLIRRARFENKTKSSEVVLVNI